MRRSSKSASKYPLSLLKPPNVNKNSDHLKFGPKKPVCHSFQNFFWHLMSKLDGLVVRWPFVSTNGRKMLILGAVCFKSSSWTDYCLGSWFVHQKLNTFSALFVHCRLSHLSWLQGLKSVPLSFWPQVTNHDGKSKLLKTWLLMSWLFHTTFSWCWKTE